MATNPSPARAARVQLWQALALGAAIGAIIGVVVALVIVHGSYISFGDLPTWLLVAAAVWAGAIALRQLRDQQAQIASLRERQISADHLLGLQLAKALEETAGSVRIEVRELKFKFVPGLRLGTIVNFSGTEIRDVAVRAQGVDTPVELMMGGTVVTQRPTLKPGAMALFAPAPQLYAHGREVRWTARFTDISGQSWQIDAGGLPRRVTGTD